MWYIMWALLTVAVATGAYKTGEHNGIKRADTVCQAKIDSLGTQMLGALLIGAVVGAGVSDGR